MTKPARPRLHIASFLVLALLVAAAPAQEREFNDRPAFAQELGVVDASTVTLSAVHEARAALDMFAFETTADGVLTLDGRVFGSNGTELASPYAASVGILLPPGRYLTPQSSTAVQTYPAPYTLSIRHEASPLPLLPLNGSIVVTFVRNGRYSFRPALIRLRLPVAGTIDVRLPAGLRPDLFSAEMGLICSATNDGPALALPAGTYYLQVPGSSAAATVQCAFTPMPVPVLPANSLVVGNLSAGSRYAVVYHMAFDTATRVALALQPDASLGLPAAKLRLADRLMNTIFEADETGSQPNLIDTSLPPGDYYVAVWAPQFASGAGRFTLTQRTNTPQVAPVQPSVAVRAQLQPNRADAYAIEVRTPTPLGAWAQFDVAPYDYMSEVAMLDDSGHLLGRSRWLPQPDLLGRSVPVGTYYVLVRHQTNEGRAYVLTVDGTLRESDGDVESTGAAGDLLLRLASPASLSTPINPLPGLLEGLLLIDPSRAIAFPPATLPADGRLPWSVPFRAGGGISLQAVHVEPALAHGRFSNDLR